jgi:hypothetical protein
MVPGYSLPAADFRLGMLFPDVVRCPRLKPEGHAVGIVP